MTEWRRFALMREERDRALREVRQLKDDADWREADYRKLEDDNLDLMTRLAEAEAELARARNRHPSAAREKRDV